MRRVASGYPLDSSIDFPSIEDLKEDGPEITTSGGLPTCNVRARSVVTCQFSISKTSPLIAFVYFCLSFISRLLRFLIGAPAQSPIFDNPYRTVADSDEINMFRSFHSMDRARKAVKPSKKSFREQTKLKLQQKLDSPGSGR